MDRTGLPALARRLRRELFASRTDGLITLVLLGALVALGGGFLRWALVQAQWAVVQANSTLFAVGRYPLDQPGRLWLLTTRLPAAPALSGGMLRGRSGPRNDAIAAVLLGGLALAVPLFLQLTLAIQARWWGITALLLALRWGAGRWGHRENSVLH